jgi:hypothetical protein
MKHIKTFDQVNEGIIDSIKEFIFPSIYRISYEVTHTREAKKSEDGKQPSKENPKDKEKKENFRSQHKFLDVKAKDDEVAEDKFQEMVSKELQGLDPKPKVEIISIHKVKKMEYKTLKLY